MATIIEETAAPPPHLLTLLQEYSPKSHPLLRRLQFAQKPNGTSPEARVLFASSIASTACTSTSRFAAAYLDLSKGPETEMWLFSTLELENKRLHGDEAEDTENVLALFRRVRTKVESEYHARGRPRFYGRCVLPGSMCERVREVLLAKGVVMPYRNPHVKYVFTLDGLPVLAGGDEETVFPGDDGEGMRWDTVKREDVPLIISRTEIPKSEATLMTLPSLCVRLTDGTMIAWAFMSVDGSLATLHVEEGHRGRGMAKALAVKLIRQHNGYFGDDGYCTADVHVDNKQSQGVCKSIGGTPGWYVSWVRLDLDTVGEGI